MNATVRDLYFCLIVALLCILVPSASSAQNQPRQERGQPAVTMTRLSAPIYPLVARQARISGEVRIQLQLRKDGSVESTKVTDGHPMLAQAAMESAQKSQYACYGCGETPTPYSIIYGFNLLSSCHFGPHCSVLDSEQPRVEQSAGRVTVTAEALCTCDPTVTRVRVKIRSSECLYLWKCGHRDISDE